MQSFAPSATRGYLVPVPRPSVPSSNGVLDPGQSQGNDVASFTANKSLYESSLRNLPGCQARASSTTRTANMAIIHCQSDRHKSEPHTYDRPRHKAAIALGSNVGDRINHIEQALSEMKKRGLQVLQTSPLYETEPMYYQDQGAFLNGVCQVGTNLGPIELLDVLQEIEIGLGRRRDIPKGPRTLDLDILLFDNEHVSHERLEVPHKLMTEREFVLRPLTDILGVETLPPSYPPCAGAEHSIREFLDPVVDTRNPMRAVTVLSNRMPLLKTADPTRETKVMAILNVTPDSFSDGGADFTTDREAIQRRARDLIQAGATILDIGGQSTRPRAELLTSSEELGRVLPVVEAIRTMPEARHIAISVDTFYSQVAKAAVAAGADIINDVSAGNLDPDMLSTAANLRKTIVLMHMRGTPHTMTKLTNYPKGVVRGVVDELSERVRAAEAAGIPRWRIVLDPGIGFAKTQAQNLELLAKQGELRATKHSALAGLPWLVGTSRKGFIGKITDVEEPKDRKWGTAAAVTASIAGGADIVRVHDVAEMVQVAKMADAIYRRKLGCV